MTPTSARLTAGHFFKAAAVMLAFLGCGSDPVSHPATPEDYDYGMMLVFLELSGDPAPGYPEVLEGSARGRFHTMHEELPPIFETLFLRADSAGMLILAVVPDTMRLEGSRDHLLILTDSAGIPVRTIPDIDGNLVAPERWSSPEAAQETIMDLVEFFRPEIVLIKQDIPGDVAATMNAWREEEVVMAAYRPPAADRGWAAFTGCVIEEGTVPGLTPSGFMATVLLAAGLDWRGYGYPAMHVFRELERE